MGAILFLLVAGGVFAMIIAISRANARRNVSGAAAPSRDTGSDSGHIGSGDDGMSMWSAGSDASGDSGGGHSCDSGGSDSGSSDCGSGDSGGGSD